MYYIIFSGIVLKRLGLCNSKSLKDLFCIGCSGIVCRYHVGSDGFAEPSWATHANKALLLSQDGVKV